jgi:hypothetical protein
MARGGDVACDRASVGEGDELFVRETAGVAPHNISYRPWGVDTSIKSMS